MSDKEIRCIKANLEVRDSDLSSGNTLVGYAAVFNSDSEDLGGFIERIKPGAFTRSVNKPKRDIKALYNHDSASILGRLKNGSLKLEQDERGLKVTITPPNTQFGRDILENVRSGYLDNMSFGFVVNKDSWEIRDGAHYRTLEDVELFEVSVVSSPAYSDTAVAVRSHEQFVKEAEQPVEQEAQAEEFIESKVEEAQAEVTEESVEEVSPEAKVEEVIDIEGLMQLGELQKTINDLKKDL